MPYLALPSLPLYFSLSFPPARLAAPRDLNGLPSPEAMYRDNIVPIALASLGVPWCPQRRCVGTIWSLWLWPPRCPLRDPYKYPRSLNSLPVAPLTTLGAPDLCPSSKRLKAFRVALTNMHPRLDAWLKLNAISSKT